MCSSCPPRRESCSYSVAYTDLSRIINLVIFGLSSGCFLVICWLCRVKSVLQAMEVVIRSLRGSCVLNVEENTTVSRLKELLLQKQPEFAPPEQQRLVHKHAQLPNEVQLQQAGIMDGDQLVLLEAKPLLMPQAVKVTPAPDAAAIRAAITEEARRRGIEHTLKEERSAAQQRRHLALPRQLLGSLGGVDDQLVQLLEQALDGQFSLANLRLSGSENGAEQEEQEEVENGQQEIQAPEPQAANIAQLTDMGFAEALARKALILTRDNVQVAVEWLFEHGDEPNAADAPTQEQLRLVYGRRRGQRRQGMAAAAAGDSSGNSAAAAAAAPAAPPVPVEVVLSQLTEMGFDAAAAQQALAHVGPHLDLAVGVLLGQGLSAAIARERGGSSESSSMQGRQQSNSRGGDPAGTSAAGGGTSSRAAAGAAETRDEAAGDDGAEFDTAEEDGDENHEQGEDGEGSGYNDEEEDEYLDYEDEDEDQQDHLPLHLEQALGTMGSMDLDGLGSADMEQLLQGVAIQELYGSQLLMAGGIEGGMGGGGPQGSLLRLMEAPGLLQQMVTALQAPAQQQLPQQQRQEAAEERRNEGEEEHRQGSAGSHA